MQEKCAMLISKSVAAATLIAICCMCNLLVGGVPGAILFSFGLLVICINKLNLFTGKCGYIFESKQNLIEIIPILIINMIFAFSSGVIFSFIDENLQTIAISKVESWYDIPYFIFFIQAIMCGVIMFTAVDVYKNGSKLGIIFGVPIFILCGFQHSIADAAYAGMAGMFSIYPTIAAAGNLIGSLLAWTFNHQGA